MAKPKHVLGHITKIIKNISWYWAIGIVLVLSAAKIFANIQINGSEWNSISGAKSTEGLHYFLIWVTDPLDY